MIKKMVLLFLIVVLVNTLIPASLGGASQAEAASPAEGPYFQNKDLYIAGTEGYHTFRIPSIISTQAGTLLAFAEGRKNSASDTGNIDLVLKRSFDQGQTWQPLQIVCDMGGDTCGNPTAVQDESTGRIWLFLTHNYGEDTIEEINNGTSRGVRTIWSTYSEDDGETWSPPVNRFQQVQQPNTRWDATGPGIGIQLKHGPVEGRLVIPAIGRNIQSDDHGATWYESGRLPNGLNEATVVELTDGTLMRNDRLSNNREKRSRGISTSTDQGSTWSPIYYDPILVDPICEASIIRYKPSDHATGNRMLLFANPADSERRENMTVRISYDDGQTWPAAKTVYQGHSAYSSLAILPDGTASLLFEGGEYTAYDKIMVATFNLEWFQTMEPDLEQLLISEGTLSPAFRGDIEEYRLDVYEGTQKLTLTPITNNENVTITIDGQRAAIGMPKVVLLEDMNAVMVEARLGERVRLYTLHLDQTGARPELLLHWDFDQMVADRIEDLTGNGHVGILNNGAALRPGGLSGDALYLHGERAHVEMTNEEDLHTDTDDFTFSVWINPEALFQQRHILYWYGVAGKGLAQWWFAVEKNGAVRMNMTGLPLEREVGTATIAGLVKAGKWTHVTAVREGSVNKIYVNGSLATTSVQYDSSLMSITNHNAPPLVGYDKGTVANRDWKGYMDDLRFYKNAMHAGEIQKLYWSGDNSSPVTQVDILPGESNGANNWYATDVSVTLSVYDDLSGVARTEYRLNDGDWKLYEGVINIASEGTNVLDYRSFDRAGNIENHRNLILRIDKTAPEVTVKPDKTELWPPNGKMVPIQVNINATDDVSGISKIELVSITGSENGHELDQVVQAADIQNAEYGTDDRTFSLRAKRSGGSAGRMYTIEYRAVDLAGHVTIGASSVFVKHDQSE
jgi:sialidase-1